MKILVINCSPVRNGATAEIVRRITETCGADHETRAVCIDDYEIAPCKGCRGCHQTAVCALHDGVEKLMEEFARADRIVCVSPSYWADVPGQFKVFIDRCTPWCNTHEPHVKLPSGKKGFAVALRTGPGMPECEKILGTIRHFYGHLEIEDCGGIGLTGIGKKEDLAGQEKEIGDLCERIRMS